MSNMSVGSSELFELELVQPMYQPRIYLKPNAAVQIKKHRHSKEIICQIDSYTRVLLEKYEYMPVNSRLMHAITIDLKIIDNVINGLYGITNEASN